MARVTTQARRLCRDHNNGPYTSGDIHEVCLDSGRIGRWVASYAATQYPIEMVEYTGRALLRIGNGRMTEKEAQRFLDEKGQGW